MLAQQPKHLVEPPSFQIVTRSRGRQLRRAILFCRCPWAEPAVAVAWLAPHPQSGGAGACCPRDRLLVAARLAPSVGGRSGVLRLEMYAQSPSTLVPDADNAWSENSLSNITKAFREQIRGRQPRGGLTCPLNCMTRNLRSGSGRRELGSPRHVARPCCTGRRYNPQNDRSPLAQAERLECG